MTTENRNIEHCRRKLEAEALAYARLVKFAIRIEDNGAVTHVNRDTYIEAYRHNLEDAAIYLLLEMTLIPLPEKS